MDVVALRRQRLTILGDVLFAAARAAIDTREGGRGAGRMDCVEGRVAAGLDVRGFLVERHGYFPRPAPFLAGRERT